MNGVELAEQGIRMIDRASLWAEQRKARKAVIVDDGKPARLDAHGRPFAWRCHVCGTTRPDYTISVLHSWTSLRTGVVHTPLTADRARMAGEPVIETNIRYCADKRMCTIGASKIHQDWIAPIRRLAERLGQ